MEIKDVLKTTEKIAQDAVLFAGKMAAEGAKKAADGVIYTKETISDSIDKAKEISRISKYCEELKEKINSQQQIYEAEYSKEVTLYSEQCDKVIEKAKIISQYQEYLQKNNTAVIVSKEKFQGATFDTGASPEGVTIAASSIAQGAAVGAAAGAGAASLMALFGTASTGTAISSLSGAAFTHALLASFGGGAIAAGGAGMAGGMVVLGSLITVPAVIVGGNIAVKKINEKYVEAKRAEKDAQEKEVLCGEVFSQYEDAISFMRQLNYDFVMFDRVFSKAVSQLAVVANSGRAELIEKNDAIITTGTDLINEFLTVSLVDDINQPIFSSSLTDQLEESILNYSNQLAIYMLDLTEDEQEIAHQMESVSLDDFNKEVERASMLTEELTNARKIIEDLEKRIHDMEDDAAKDEVVSDAANELMIKQMPQHYEIHLQNTKRKYPLFNDADVIEIIANAELYYDAYACSGGSDFSSVGSEYAKAIELILKQMIKNGILTSTNTELVGKGKSVDKMMLGEMFNTYVKKNVGILGKDFVHNLEKFIELRNAGVHSKIINLEQVEEIKRLAVTKKSGAIIPTLHRKMKKRG